MRALLTAAGTRGDVQPLFAFARALQRAGHDAVVAGPPDFVAEAAALGVRYVPCGPDMQQLVRAQSGMGANPITLLRAARKTAHADLIAHFDALLPLAREADVIVGAGLMFAAASVAEVANVPYRYLAYTPDALRSAYHAPPLSDIHSFGRPLNRWLWQAFAGLTHFMLAPGLNQRRRAFGLRDVDNVLDHAMSPERALLAADAEIAPCPPDVRLAGTQLGGLRLDDERPLPEALERFLEAGDPPVYFGFGSMPAADPIATTRDIVACAKRVGVRAVIARGWAGLGEGVELGPNVHVVDDVTHRRLFPRVAVVVHHGGAGTTDAAMLAGVPQLVVPHLLDQFGWSRRVHALGLGPAPLPRYRWSRTRLTEQVWQALRLPEHARRASALSQRLRARDGLAEAIGALETAVRIPRRSIRPSRRPQAAPSLRPASASMAP